MSYDHPNGTGWSCRAIMRNLEGNMSGAHQFIYSVGELVVGIGVISLLFLIGREIERWIRNI